MAMNSGNFTSDAQKYIQDKLISMTERKLVMADHAESVTIPKGNGKTANFTRVNRCDVPLGKLTEGQTPTETDFSISTQSVTVDQYGMYITLTDVSQLTTKHPMLEQALKVKADAISRLKDLQIGEILLDATNKQYWDGSRANMAAITANDTIKGLVVNKVRADMNDKGVAPKRGRFFVAIAGPQVIGDFLGESAAVGGYVAAAQYSAIEKLVNAEVGKWLGVIWIETNHIPKYTLISTVSAPTAGAGGSLSGTVYYKVTRKAKARGFEEGIQAQGSTAMSTNTRLAFSMPATAGYVYNVYAGSATGDSNLFLVAENLEPSATFNLDALATSGQTPPETPPSGVTVHPIIFLGEEAFDDVGLEGAGLEATITPPGASDSDPLKQRRKVGSKFMAKAGIRDAERVKVVYLASAL